MIDRRREEILMGFDDGGEGVRQAATVPTGQTVSSSADVIGMEATVTGDTPVDDAERTRIYDNLGEDPAVNRVYQAITSEQNQDIEFNQHVEDQTLTSEFLERMQTGVSWKLWREFIHQFPEKAEAYRTKIPMVDVILKTREKEAARAKDGEPEQIIETKQISSDELAEHLIDYLDYYADQETFYKAVQKLPYYGVDRNPYIQKDIERAHRQKIEVILTALEYSQEQIVAFFDQFGEKDPTDVDLLMQIARNVKTTEDPGSEAFKKLEQRLVQALVESVKETLKVEEAKDGEVGTAPTEQVEIAAMNGAQALEQVLLKKGLTPTDAKAKVQEFLDACKASNLDVTETATLENLLIAVIGGGVKNAEDIAKAAEETTTPAAERPNTAAEVDGKVKINEKNKFKKAAERLLGISAEVANHIAVGMTIGDFIMFLCANRDSAGFSSYKDRFKEGSKVIGENEIKNVFPTPKAIFDTMEEALLTPGLGVDGETIAAIHEKQEKFIKVNDKGQKEFDEKAYQTWLISKYKLNMLLNQKEMMKILKEQLCENEKGRTPLTSINTSKGSVQLDKQQSDELEISQEAFDWLIASAMLYAKRV